jgi:hypothetical protein
MLLLNVQHMQHFSAHFSLSFIACSQHYPQVEAWISEQIDLPVNSGRSCSFYCCLLLEYLRYHNRWSDFCKKCLEIVNSKGYRVSLDHKIAWLNMALNSTNGRTPQELPQKSSVVDQIQLCLKVLHLHKLAHDRLCNLLKVQQGDDHSRIMRWAIHFRMWNSSVPFFQSSARTGVSHKFEDCSYRLGPYDNSVVPILNPSRLLRSCLRDHPLDQPSPCTSMLGKFEEGKNSFENGLLARYRDDLRDGEVAYPDHAFLRKILSNSMFFDLEIILLHTVLPIQNQQEIYKCIEKIMVQSWFDDQIQGHDYNPIDNPAICDAVSYNHWPSYCMRLDYDENFVGNGFRVRVLEHVLRPTGTGIQHAIESLRRYVHSFFEIAPKSQDVLRIMFPPEALVTFACTNISHDWTLATRRHYICAIADILLGYTSPLYQDFQLHPMKALDPCHRAHAFISYNALQPEGYHEIGRPQTNRAKGRDRCLSLRNLWDALPHIYRTLPDSKFLTAKLALAARQVCLLLLTQHFFSQFVAQTCLRDRCLHQV